MTTQSPARPAATVPARPRRPAPTERGRGTIRLLQLAVIAGVVVIWWLVAALELVSSTALPGPIAVADAFVGLFGNAGFWLATGQTLRAAVLGLVSALVIGIVLGLVTGTYAATERASRLLVDFLRSFPVIALLPVFLLVLGSRPEMEATVVFIACLFPVFLQAQYGARSVTPTIDETIRSYRIPRWLRFTKVILPSATPSIMTGARLAATTSVLVAIGVEILTTLPGIGHEVAQDQQNGSPDIAFAYILVAGLLGYGINKGSELLESHLLRWRQNNNPN